MNTVKISVIAALLLSFFILPNSVLAPILNPYSGGSGTAGDPYQIGSVGNLLYLRTHTGDYGKYFILIADIDLDPNLPGGQVFTTAVIAPDTNNSDPNFNGTTFTGVFDGNGHTISNLTIDTNGAGNNYLGLFGSASHSQVRNLQMENVRITIGATAKYLGGLMGDNSGDVNNCYLTGNISISNITGSSYLGGMVGFNSGSISNCYSTGAVGGSVFIGGLVGYNNYSGTISNCLSSSHVTGLTYLGGMVGSNNIGNISNCCSTGTVSGTNYVGGLVGSNAGGSISNCYSTGAVSGTTYIGGLAGDSDGTISNCYATGTVTGGNGSSGLGGLVGLNFGSISNCYAIGTITSGSSNPQNLGGIIGYNNSGTISNCYFLNTEPNNGYGTPLTDKKMKLQASFVGWDFNDIWWIAEKAGYPKFYWQLDVTKCSVTAGSKPNTDKISFSGTMGAAADDFNGIDAVKVTINSPDIVIPFDQNFPVDANTFKKGKYSYSGTENGIKKSLTYDVKTHKFAFSASNLDLSGLDCPVIVKIDINDFNAIALLDEAIVNGPKMPIPIQLMTDVKNVLRVDKCTVKQNNKKANSDQLSVSGGFTVANPDPNMANWITNDLVITLDTQTFTVPAGKLKTGKGTFSCSNAKITDPNATATATFNFNLCSFTLAIKDANIPPISGVVNFGMAFADFNEVEQVMLP